MFPDANPPEVCPLGLTPTTSTTVMTVMGDALVVLMMEKIGFTAADYAKRHHGGYLGDKSRNYAPEPKQKSSAMRITREYSLGLIIDIQEQLLPHIHDHVSVKRNTILLIRGLQILRVPVIPTEQYPKGLGVPLNR